MEVFGIVGMSMGTMGFIFGLNAMGKVDKMEKKLQELGILDREAESK